MLYKSTIPIGYHVGWSYLRIGDSRPRYEILDAMVVYFELLYAANGVLTVTSELYQWCRVDMA